MFHWFSKKHTRAATLHLLLSCAAAGLSPPATAQEPETWSIETETESAAPNEGDVTETIGTEEDTPSSDVPEQAEPTESEVAPAARIQLSGYVRESLEIVYGELLREKQAGGLPVLWRDVFISRSDLVLRASYLQGRSFEATISGRLGYTLQVAKAAPEYSVGVVDLARGKLEPELREAYLGFFWPDVDLRIGQQRMAWGRADSLSPNDVINARDLRDPFLTETDLRHLPTFAVRSSVNAGPVTFEVVVSPFFVPDRFDVYGATWSVVQYHAPEEYKRFLGSTSLLVDPTVDPELARLWRQTELPPNNGKGASAGARFAASLSGVDLSAYYHYGYDSTPFVTLDPAFTSYLTNPATDLTLQAPLTTKFTPVLELIDRGIEPISARYLRRHHVGLDVATAIGPVIVRADAAYETRRIFYELDLNSFASPTVLGVFGLEYQTGSMDDTVLIELIASHLLQVPEPDALPLLAFEQTNLALAGTLRWTLGESWGVDLRGLVGIVPESYAVLPAIRYKPSDAFSLKIGALIVSGAEKSFGWYYGDNDTAFLQLRYAF